ncbi:MAG: gliding motility-associated C-terminal domain-containing protein [Bacteroidota bacterium]|nr:gliding motility-associated C-terminal domain-containing protein [Bacteroidota bacterium]
MLRKLLLLFLLITASASIKAEKLYWVGGSGSFNDPSHWSLQSGGNPGAKIPTLYDDVFFDKASFKTFGSAITIVGNAFCKKFIVEDNAFPFSIEGSIIERIKVQGDFKLNKTTKWNLDGSLEFTGENVVTIDFGLLPVNGTVVLNSSAGNFKLNSSLDLGSNGSLILENGSLSAKDISITGKNFIKKSNAPFDLNIDNVLIEFKNDITVTKGLRINSVNSQLIYNQDNTLSVPDSNVFSNMKIIEHHSVLAITDVQIVDSVSCPGACDGSFLVSFTLTAGQAQPPYTLVFTPGPSTLGPFNSSPFLATGLCGANYTIRLFNNLGNQVGSSANNVMYEPSPIAVNFNLTTDPLCNTDCTGEIQYDIIGGNPTYNLTWNPGGIIQNGLDEGDADSIENLCANTYIVDIIDRKGCTATDQYIIVEPNPILPNSGVQDQLCFSYCDGMVFVAPSGGTPFGVPQANGTFYTIVWNGNAALTNDTLYNLCPGTYNYVITDANGCTMPGSVIIDPISQLIFTPSVPVPVTCADVCDGTANVSNISGGTGPGTYTYSWAGPTVPAEVNTANSTTASGMCPGVYTCTITDANGCDTIVSFTITGPALLVGTVTPNDVSCFGLTDGSATGSELGGNGPPFTYNWFSTASPTGGPPFSNANPTVSGLAAGNYTLVIVDINGCNDTVPFVINEPLPLQVTLTPTNPTCFGFTDGQICVSTSGGTGVATFTLSPVAGVLVANCYTGLSAGPYTVNATDANSCPASASTTLISLPQIFPNLTHTDPTCNLACNGTATSAPTGGSGAGYTFVWSCNAGTTSSINGECAGVCNLTVTDGNGCPQNASVTFVDPNPLALVLNNTNLSCSGASTAQITSVVNGGTAPYTYAWTGLPDVTPGLANVGAGSYTLTVTDFNGCTIIDSVTVTAPLPISITTTPTNPTCFGSCNGSITTVLGGGTAPYTQLWLPTNSASLNQINLCAGTYDITVTDANNCTQTQSVILTAPQPIVVTTDTTVTSCINVCDGTATANAVGGNPGGYTYSWTGGGGAAQTTGPLCDGTYNVTVTDPLGCTGIGSATITEPTVVTTAIISITPSCSNICNGTATINPGGGTPGYTHTIDAAPIGASTALSGLCAGPHTVVTTDNNGCTASTNFIVPLQVTLSVTASPSVLTCFGDCNGTATANVVGGAPVVTFDWQPTGQTTQTAVGLCSGVHTISVTDGIGCIVSTTVTFTDPPALTLPIVVTPVDCNGNCTGTATANPGGGVAPYSVTWSNGGVGNSISNLCVGSYDATVIDGNGCSLTQTGTVIQPSAFTITLTPASPTTCGGTDGSIAAVVAGGTGAYDYSWAPSGQITATVTNVGAGVHTLTITDQNTGCDSVISFGLSDPNAPGTTSVFSNATCPNQCNGTATVDVTSGTAPFTVTFPGGVPTGAPPLTSNTLCNGAFAVQVTDATACVAFENIVITEPANFVDNEVLSDLTCNGNNSGSIVLAPTGGTRPFTYVLDGLPEADSSMTGLSAGPHVVVVTDANGCTYSFNYNLSEPNVLTGSEVHTNVNCTTGFGTATVSGNGGTLPYTFLWSGGLGVTASVANVPQGNYTCDITDANGCTVQVAVVIGQNPALVSGFTFADNLCSSGCTGTASFNASGGSGVYTYSWSGSGSVASSINGICPGAYIGTVSDDNGCSVTENFTISAPIVLDVTSVATDPLCNNSCNGTITANPTGGTGAYTYVWSPNVNPNPTSVNLCAGTYTVDVTDANGCTAQDVIVLTDPPALFANVTPTQPICFGDCNGILTSTPSGGTAPYAYAWGAPIIDIDSIAGGLCIGNYSVTVTDANGCTDVANIGLTQPPQVGLAASSSPATCGLFPCNGSVTINSIVGTTVNWLTPVGLPCPSCLAQNSLCAGIYDIEVSDAVGCKDTVQVTVSNSSGPLVDVDSTNVSCRGGADGEATVVSVVGTGPYTYAWGAPIPDLDSIASGLVAGTYTSQVTDGIGCMTFTEITVNEPGIFDDQESITDASCNGVNDGSIVLNPSGGTAPYSYAWSNGAPDSPSNLNIAPGNYDVTITDANLCTYQFSYTVGTNAQILYDLTVTNASCFAQCNGTAILNNINGGTAPYTFVWSDGQSGTTANGLCAGNYTVTISDLNGCSTTVDTTISEPVQLNVNPTVTNTACSVCAGSIALAPVGGTGGYTYLWSNGQSAATATNLCAGVYMVDVTDAAGCVNQQNIAVNNTSGPTINTVTTDVTCSGSCNGSATATPVGGTLPYQYNWLAGGQTTSAVANLCAGTYFVQVKDGANCVINDTVVINETSILAANLSHTPTTCGASVGQAIAAPSGGTGPYTFVWSTGSNNDTISNLAAGTYSLEITDANGCKDTSFATINSNNGPVVTVATDSTLCNASADGSATLTIVGGVAPYTIVWSTGLNANSQTHTNLADGVYSVVVTDNGGCASVKNFSIEEPDQLALSLNNTQLPSCQVACNGVLTAIPSGGSLAYTYVWSNGGNTASINNLCSGLYSLTVTDANGCTATQATQLDNDPNPFGITDNNVNASCGQCDGTSALTLAGGTAPFTFNWSNGDNTSTATNLCAGIYMVDVTDNLGCFQQHSVSINNANGPTVSVVSTDVNCEGQCTGTATATGAGGTAPYQYNWIGLGQVTPSVSNLCADTYFVQVKDANNCVTNDTVIINETTILVATPAVTNATCGVCDGSVILNPTGGSGNYTYVWSNGLPATISQSNLCAQTYSVEITDVINGCKDTSFVTISSDNAPTLVINTDSTSCNGTADGQAVLTINGGTGPYSIVWSTGLNVDATTHTSLSAGNYAVTVTDFAGCVNAQVFDIEEAASIALSLNNSQLPSCDAACNGSLIAIPSGGTLNYTYAWSNGGVLDSIGSLCAGPYSVTVTDANGCTATQFTQLNNNPTPFTITDVSVNATCGINDGSSVLTVTGAQTPITYNWSNGSITSSASNLFAGIHTVDVTDNVGCTQQYNVSINNLNGPTINVVTTDVACAGQCTGTAVVTPAGGTTPYQFNWLPGGETTSSLANMCATINYFVQVKDANNCVTNQAVNIIEQNILAANPSVTNATCGLVPCNGAVTLNTGGGSGNYTYAWSNGLPATSTQSNMCAGTYSVEITDGTNGCKDTSFVTISNTNAPTVSINTDSVSCNGGSNGQAVLTINGGTGPYSIDWSTGLNVDATTHLSLSAGNYAVTVTDFVGCIMGQAFDIGEGTQLALSLNNTQLPNCAAVCNGALAAIPSGGTLNYTYLWSPSGETTDIVDSMCSGTYIVTVTDAKGCTKTQTTILNDNPTPFTVTTAVIEPGCNLCDGLIDMTITGGNPPFTYVWSNGDLVEDIDTVCAGVYDVMITDGSGCSQTETFPINNVAGISGETIVSSNETCSGLCDGTATVTPIGGTPGYTYQWLHNGDTTNSQTGLCASGSPYFLQISDTNNCIRTSEVDILSPNQMTAVPFVVAPTCSLSDGTITLNVSGGTGILSYVWNPAVAGNTNTATGLSAGVYTIDVTDATSSCTQSFTVTLSDANGPLVSVLDSSVSCNGVCDGNITLTITSANPTTVLWSTGAGGTLLSGLCPGNYTAVVTDNVVGCATAVSTIIIEPDTINFSVPTTVDPLCFGVCSGSVNAVPSGGILPYTYSWSPVAGNNPSITNVCANTYTVTVTDANGCISTQSTTLTEPPVITISGAVTNTSCTSVAAGAIDITVGGGAPGYTYQWSGGSVANTEDLNAILFGEYIVTVTDTNLCSMVDTFNVAATDTAIANAGIDQVFCINGNVTLDGTLSNVNNGTITYSWEQIPSTGVLGTVDTLVVSPTVGATSYQLVITNSLGCSDTDTVALTANLLPLANAGTDQEMFMGQTITIGGNPTGPAGTIFTWLPNLNLNSTTIANPVASATLAATYNYTVVVTDTVTGCVARDSMVLTVLPRIIIPNGISPNGDGKNDVWIIDAIYKFPNNEVEIYNRWGELLYAKTAYDNTWDGSYKGKPLPIGTYYYVVKLNDPDYPEPYTGPITIFK